MRCEKCGSITDKEFPAYGFKNLCTYCVEKLSDLRSILCYHCAKEIWPHMSRYEGHNVAICQFCFKDKIGSCFNCKFPLYRKGKSKNICEFCKPLSISETVSPEDIRPILLFISKHWCLPPQIPEIVICSSEELISVQSTKKEMTVYNAMENMLEHYYPVCLSNDKIYTFNGILKSWFIPYFTGQLVKHEIGSRFGISVSKAVSTPFEQMVAGIGHYFIFLVAKLFKDKPVLRFVERFPNHIQSTAFLKIKAMAEHRSHAELKSYVNTQLLQFAKKYHQFTD